MSMNDDGNTLIKIVGAVGNLKIEIWASDFQHALDGHPEVTLDKISETLMAPCKVIESKRSARACLFYSVVIEDQDCETRYFCVVVGVISTRW